MNISIMRRVVGLIGTREEGANADELWALLPQYTREQVYGAIKTARTAKLIHCHGRTHQRGAGTSGGSIPATYYHGPKSAAGERPSPLPTPEIVIRPPASVWELAHSLQIAGDWPPAGEGRAYLLLSDGDEQAEEAAA